MLSTIFGEAGRAAIDVLTGNLPAVAPGVGLEFRKLKVAIPDLVYWVQFGFTPISLR
jgi:hypothetical protein